MHYVVKNTTLGAAFGAPTFLSPILVPTFSGVRTVCRGFYLTDKVWDGS